MSILKSLKLGVGCLTAGIGQILLSCLSLGIHLFTIYTAFSLSGIFGGILTIFFPPLSEIAWFIILWIKFGFLNIYTYTVLGYIVIVLLSLGGMYLASSSLED
ncbi:MAG: hypothetical protein WC364_04715 [Eubacteriales bacterium]